MRLKAYLLTPIPFKPPHKITLLFFCACIYYIAFLYITGVSPSDFFYQDTADTEQQAVHSGAEVQVLTKSPQTLPRFQSVLWHFTLYSAIMLPQHKQMRQKRIIMAWEFKSCVYIIGRFAPPSERKSCLLDRKVGENEKQSFVDTETRSFHGYKLCGQSVCESFSCS